MPAEILLHETNPFAFDRIAEYHGRLFGGYRRQPVKSINNLSHIMSVYFHHIPVKGSPFIRVWLKVHVFVVKAGHHLFVSVDNADQVTQFIGTCGICRFPDLTFTSLSITHHAEHTV